MVEGGCVVITPQAPAEKTSFCLSAERPAEAFSRRVPVRTWSPWVGVFSFTFPAVCSLQISFKPIISCNLDHFFLGFPTPFLLFSCQSSWLSLSFTGKRKTLLFWGDPAEELRVGLNWATSLSLFPFKAQKTFYSLKGPIEAPLVNSFIWIVKLVFWLYRAVFWLFLWGFLINRSASIFNSIQHTGRKSITQDHVSCKPKFKAQSKDNTERVSVQFLIVHVTEFYFHYIDTNHRR